MITQTEAQVTDAQYAVLRNQQSGPKFVVELHQHNFRFDDFHTGVAATDDESDFAVAQTLDRLIRVVDGGSCEIFDGNAWSLVSIPNWPANSAGRLSLVVSGNEVWCYVITYTGIQLVVSTDQGDTWGSWHTAYSFAASSESRWRNALNIAAIAPGRVFWTIMDAATNAVNLRYSTAATTFTLTAGVTDTWFTTSPRGMDAALCPSEYDANRAVLVMTLDTPGSTTLKLINGDAVRYIFRSGGIISFVCENDILSDHVEVDVLQQYANFRYREQPRLTKLGDTYFLIAACGDGQKLYNFRRYRFYTSKDCYNWSKGAILPGVPSKAVSAMGIYRLGDYVYAVRRKDVKRSPSTWLSNHSTVVYDVSHRTMSYQAEVGDMRQSALMLSNEDGFFDTAQFTSPEYTWTLVHKWGYDGAPVVQVGVEEIDNFDNSIQLDGGKWQKITKVTARDRLAWMSDAVQNEQPRFWQAQIVGADAFEDTTGTGYGGMAHTEQKSGAFRTESDTLLLTSNNEIGVAFSTFDTDTWNGGVEYGFTLSQPDKDEYAGVCFRAIDKDNLWAAIYYQTSDKISLIRKVAGSDTQLVEGAALGWTSAVLNGRRYIRADFRYGYILVETSEDGITWSHYLSYIVHGVDVIVGESCPVVDRPIERGSVGCIGKGFSSLDNWEWPNPTEGISDYFDTNGEPQPYEPTVPINTDEAPGFLAMSKDGSIHSYTIDWNAHTATVVDVGPGSTIAQRVTGQTDGLSSPAAYCIVDDPHSVGTIYLQGRGGIARCDDIYGESPTWEFIEASAAADIRPYEGYDFTPSYDATGTPDKAGCPIRFARTRPGFAMWSSGGWLYTTNDGFKTITRRTIGTDIYDIAIGPYNTNKKGEIWLACGQPHPGLLRSNNWGARFDSAVLFALTSDHGQIVPTCWTKIYIPLMLRPGVPNKSHLNIQGMYVYSKSVWTTLGNDTPAYDVYLYNLNVSPYNETLAYSTHNLRRGAAPASWLYHVGSADGRVQIVPWIWIENKGNLDEQTAGAQLTFRWSWTDELNGNYRAMPEGTSPYSPFTPDSGRSMGIDGNHWYDFSNIIGYPTNPRFYGVACRGGNNMYSLAVPQTYVANKFMVSLDGWSSYTDLESDMATARTAAGISGFSTGEYYRWMISDTRAVSQYVVDDDWNFDYEDPTFDWEDDGPGIGDWEMPPEYCITFVRSRIHDRAGSRTVEDIMRSYCGFANIHDFKFRSIYDPANGLPGWTVSGGTLESSGNALILTSGSAIHSAIIPHSAAFDVHVDNIANAGFLLNLRSSTSDGLTDCHYKLTFPGGKTQIQKYIPGSGYQTLYTSALALPSSGKLTVIAREMVLGSEAGNIWLNVSVWCGNRLYATFLEWTKTSPETNYWLGLLASGEVTFTNLHVPQLCEIVDWNSLDTGETAMSGLQRAIEGRNVQMLVRGDESVYAWQPSAVPQSHVFDNDDLEGYERQTDNRQRVTHIRMLGAYVEAEYVRDDLGNHRFRELNNPYLMTELECYDRAVLELEMQEEQYEQVSIATSFRPLLEVADRVQINGVEYIINSQSVELTPAQGVMQVRARRYIVGA